MKYFVAVLVFAILATALAFDKEKVKEGARKFKKASEDCNADPATFLDYEALRKARSEGNTEEPANAGPHALCISKTLGWQNADGTVNEEVVRSRATAIFSDNPKLKEIVAECIQAQGTPEATAKHLVECWLKNSPRPAAATH